jgi:Fe-S cluster assembly protein SufB
VATPSDIEHLKGIDQYKYGFSDPDVSVYNTGRGLSEEVVRQISAMKGEPEWMLE